MLGKKHGSEGVYELVIRQGMITHQRFIPNGTVSGTTNLIPSGSPGGVGPSYPWWK